MQVCQYWLVLCLLAGTVRLVRGVAGLVQTGPPRSRWLRRSCCQFRQVSQHSVSGTRTGGSPGRPRGQGRQRVDGVRVPPQFQAPSLSAAPASLSRP